MHIVEKYHEFRAAPLLPIDGEKQAYQIEAGQKSYQFRFRKKFLLVGKKYSIITDHHDLSDHLIHGSGGWGVTFRECILEYHIIPPNSPVHS